MTNSRPLEAAATGIDTGAPRDENDTMKCNGCSSPMQLLRTEASARASTEWHRCPLCGKVRLTSAPQSPHTASSASADAAGADLHPSDHAHGDFAPGFFNDRPLYV